MIAALLGRDALLRAVYRVGYRILRVYWLLVRPTKRGVVCLLTRDDEVLLVRHTYGRRLQWDLPGGGLRRSEEPQAGIRREIGEELGLELPDLQFMGELFERIDGKHDQLWCFCAEVGDHPIEANAVEIAETRWFPRTALPERRAKYLKRILALAD
jgi:8-oxo-dGTP pyrophosphatase MutT (NUDIX family)